MLTFLAHAASSLLRSRKVSEFLDDRSLRELRQSMAVSLTMLESESNNKSQIIEMHKDRVSRKLEALPVKNSAEISSLKTLLKNFFDLVQDLVATTNLRIIPFEYIVQRLVQGRDMTSYAEFTKEEGEHVQAIVEEFEDNQVPFESAIRLSGPKNPATAA